MCLIIHRHDATPINSALITSGIDNNPDGWGIMAAQNGRIVTVKGMDNDAFEEHLNAFGDIPLSIHFRWATHGTKNEDNCHPFTILGGAYAVMHNGIIPIECKDKSRSDTYHFVNDVLAPMLAHDPGAFGTPEFSRLVGSIIGAGNKLVILRADGESIIVNESSGLWHDGLWLSNGNSLPMRRSYLRDFRAIDAPSRYLLNRESSRTYRDHSDWDDWDSDLVEIKDIDDDAESRQSIPVVKTDARTTEDATTDDIPDSLDDFANMSYEEISSFCYYETETVASLIWEYYNGR